jgi:HlyD family secretion protein
MNKPSLYLLAIVLLASCGKNEAVSDAHGTFEAEEIIVSAEQNGKILQLDITEGQKLDSNQVVGQIDVLAYNLQKEQAIASTEAINQKVNDARPQIEILESQIATQRAQIRTLIQQMVVLDKEILRTENLLKADAATQKQLDDMVGQKAVLQRQIEAANTQVSVLEKQITSARQNVAIQNRSVLSEVDPSMKKVAVIDEQISRGQIRNMFPGTVLAKYAMAGEYTNIGKPLYKTADLRNITLRAFISGSQLTEVKLNQKVLVLTDNGTSGFNETQGIITWINDKAEFTPKTIQTKDERANLVYAIKINVANDDGRFKIGMYGEVKF